MLRQKVHRVENCSGLFGGGINPTSKRFGISVVPCSCNQASAVCWSDSPTSLALGARPVSCMAVSISESAVSLPSPPAPQPEPPPALCLPWEWPESTPIQSLSLWWCPGLRDELRDRGSLLFSAQMFGELRLPPFALSGEVIWGSSSSALSSALPPPGARCQTDWAQGSCRVSPGEMEGGLGKAASPCTAAAPSQKQPWPDDLRGHNDPNDVN